MKTLFGIVKNRIRRMVGSKLAFAQRNVAEDDGQNIVEIVCDAAG